MTGTSNYTVTSTNFKNLLQYWVGRTYRNYGFIFMQNGDSLYRRISFCSSDYTTDTTKKPRLRVYYSYDCPAKLIPQNDNSVNNAVPASSYEYDTTLNVSKNTYEDRSFLRFNLAGIPSNIVLRTAKLKLYCKSTTTFNGSVKLVTSTWNNGVTWNNQPSASDPTISFSTVSYTHLLCCRHIRVRVF